MSPPQLFVVLFGMLIVVLCIFACLILFFDENKAKRLAKNEDYLAIIVAAIDKSVVLQAIEKRLSCRNFRGQKWQITDVSPRLGLLRAIIPISQSTEYGSIQTEVTINLKVTSRFSSGSNSGDNVIVVVNENRVAWTFESVNSSVDRTIGSSILQKELIALTNSSIRDCLSELETEFSDGKNIEVEVANPDAPMQLVNELPEVNVNSPGGSQAQVVNAGPDSIDERAMEILSLPAEPSAIKDFAFSFKPEENAGKALSSEISECPDCKRELDLSFDFCLYCGLKVR